MPGYEMRGGGGGAGRSGGRGSRGGGAGRKGGRGLGAGGTCVCPKCGATAPHKRGKPCMEMPCPECGTIMVRKD